MGVSWGTVVDLASCTGCHACSVACRAEFDRPGSDGRSHVRVTALGGGDGLRLRYAVNRCVMCEDAPCVRICPTGALSHRPDGIVDLDQDACLGCHLCQLACPYDAIGLDAARGVVEKCNLCAHRLEAGLEPACASACPTGAIRTSDLGDPDSAPSLALRDGLAITPRVELGTRPRMVYLGVSVEALDPLQARRPTRPTLAATELADGMGGGPWASGAGALHYAPPQRVPWDWRAAAAAWSRGIAAGLFLAPGLLAVVGALPLDGVVWRLVAPVVALLYLLGSLGLQAWMSERPGRASLLATRPNVRSVAWMSLASQVGFAMVLLVQLVASLARLRVEALTLAVGVPLSIAVVLLPGLALRECRGRELWTRSSQLPRLLLSAVTAGAAMLSPFVGLLSPEHSLVTGWLIALGCLATLGVWLYDTKRPPAGANGARAAWEMVHGGLRLWTVSAAALLTAGLLGPLMHAWVVPFVLGGLLAYEHATLQAGQAVPQV